MAQTKKAQDYIKIRGARVHNLKNINVDIPKNKLVVFCGVSGSGKSSLAFDTLYAEGQRRYVESLSAYARQFLGVMEKPDCDKIEGISPSISIDQRKASHNPRSTVGTTTEIYDYLRVLFARAGEPHCPKCDKIVQSQTIDSIVQEITKLPKESEFLILGPLVKKQKGEHRAILEEVKRAGFVRVRCDGIVLGLEEALNQNLDAKKKHSIEVVVDRLVLSGDLERSRLVDSLETALKMGKGSAIVNWKLKIGNSENIKSDDLMFSERLACEECSISMPDIEPRLFSFNSPFGACPVCQGLGKKLEVSPELVLPNKNLSLAQGAVFPWARAIYRAVPPASLREQARLRSVAGGQGWYFQVLESAAQENGFSIDTPIKNLSKKQTAIILYGDGAGFEGVMPNLERRFWQTDSDAAREEIKKYMVERNCPECLGKRLKKEALSVKFVGKSMDQICAMPIGELKTFLENQRRADHCQSGKQSGRAQTPVITAPLLKEIIERLGFLNEVGLDYLTLARATASLSGGEEQRTRLATQIGSQLSGVLYILDEPSIGLHPRDQEKLVGTLKKLRDTGNTVLVVEHDPLTIKEADFIVEIGPFAGKHGGEVVFSGTPKQLLQAETLTGQYFATQITNYQFPTFNELSILPIGRPVCRQAGQVSNFQKKKQNHKYLIIKGAKENNLKDIDVKIPLGKFVGVCGVSGSGKSSLVNDIIAKALFKKFYHSKEESGKHKSIEGANNLDKVVLVNQDPIGRTPRSNPATYTGCFNHIRFLFSNLKEAKIRGYKEGRFSFNVKGGRCEACEGQGFKRVEMYFLPDVFVECEECEGKRYNQETLEVKYNNKSIADVLTMTVEEAMEFFEHIPAVFDKLKTLNEVGLGYIGLGQSATSLSGGEAQRVKLATELAKKATGRTLYILDEPTTGLHPYDIENLLFVLRGLVNKGNSVLTIEHNIDFLKAVDWLIELGPDGGEKGGFVVAQGTVEDIAGNPKSVTGKYLK